MLDEILEEAVSSVELPIGSRVGQSTIRQIVGLVGAALSIAGVLHVVAGGIEGASFLFNLMAALNFGCLAAFCLLNIVLARPVRWPGRSFVLTIVLLFLVRITFGP